MSQLQTVMPTLRRVAASARQGVAALEERLGPRWTPLVLAIGIWLLLVLLLTLVFSNPATTSGSHRFGVFLLDRWATAFPYPLTIQNLIHLIFAVALGELWACWKRADAETGLLTQGFLPEDEQTMLQAEDLGPIRQRLLGQFDADHGFLPAMIDLCVLQFFASRSVDQAISVLGNKQALIAHQVVLRYRLLRALPWLLVIIGLIGTAASLGTALAFGGEGASKSAALATAFDASIVGLIEAAALMLMVNIAQSQEERAANLAGRYVLHNLINRLYTGRATA